MELVSRLGAFGKCPHRLPSVRTVDIFLFLKICRVWVKWVLQKSILSETKSVQREIDVDFCNTTRRFFKNGNFQTFGKFTPFLRQFLLFLFHRHCRGDMRGCLQILNSFFKVWLINYSHLFDYSLEPVKEQKLGHISTFTWLGHI